MTRLPNGIGVFLVVAIVILTAGCGSIVNELEGVGGPGDNDTDTDTDGEADDSSTEDENATDDSSETDDNESENDGTEESDPPDAEDDETESDDDDGGETDTDETDQGGDGDTNGDGSDGQDDQDGNADQDDGGDGDQGDGGDDDGEVAEPGQSSLTLTVVGPAGEPIEGATVAGEGEPHEADIPLEFGGETDSDGQYTDVIYENEYTILIDHPEYDATTVDHTHDGEREITVELDREGNGGSEPATSLLTLSVVDSDGEPIEGASVTGEGEPHDANIPLTFSGETDADGQYTDVIYENRYSIEVDHPDYEATTVGHTHDGESEVRIELQSENDGEPDLIDPTPEAEGTLEDTDRNVDTGFNTEVD